MNIEFCGIKVEKFKIADLSALELIFNREFREENTEIIKQRIRIIKWFYYLLLPMTYFSNWARSLLGIYVIRKEKEVIGFVQFSYPQHKQTHLDYLAIIKQYRGKGIGSKVLDAFLQKNDVGEKHDVVLEVKSTNPAYKLYKRRGFETVAKVLRYEAESSEIILNNAAKIKLNKVKNNDREQLDFLYNKSVPRKMQRLNTKNNGLIKNILVYIKNIIMNNIREEYVVHHGGKVIAGITISNYVKAHYHIISLAVDNNYELLRYDILYNVLLKIRDRYPAGKVSITVYDDVINKQTVLERFGFKRMETYNIMMRKIANDKLVFKKCGKNYKKINYNYKKGNDIKKRIY